MADRERRLPEKSTVGRRQDRPATLSWSPSTRCERTTSGPGRRSCSTRDGGPMRVLGDPRLERRLRALGDLD
jgi:hypothetical protein